MSAILMSPQTIPSRFSMQDDPSATPPAPVATRLASLVAAAAARLRSASAEQTLPRAPHSTAAAW